MAGQNDASKRKLIQSTLSEDAGSGEFQTPEIGYDEIKTEEKIGGGCFGNVYKGLCRGKVVAIKKLHQQEMDDNLLEEFRKEVAIMTHLRHPNIVLFMGACTASGHLAIVTELMPRGSLHDVLHDAKVDLPLTMKLKFARDVALAMNWLHCSHPPIIHRDLKPSNVLVDENWNLKVCDFGLSAIKRKEKMQDSGVAPGTPLWMSPEVLRGRPLNEKADTYSFAIVLWEILTRKEPFEHHDSYNTFVHAICDEKERPPIPADIHPSLKRLLEVCWNEDPDKRPNFAEILDMLDDATIRAVLEEEDAQNIWRKYAKGKDKMAFTQFARGLYGTLGYGAPDELSVPYQCLKLLVAQKSARDHEETVSLEMFSLFLRWFGGLRARSSQGNILDRVKTMCEQEWFHGNITREESEQKLANEKKGTFLIRLSLTEPEKTPYTISKVNQKGVINHQRVSVNPGGGGYHVTIKYPKETKKMEAAGPVTQLIKKVEKELYLKTACSGSMFSSLFQREEKFGGYLQDDDE